MQRDADHAFESHLRHDAPMPISWELWNREESVMARELRLKRGLGVLAAQTAFEEKRSDAADDPTMLAPELLRIDAKLNHVIDLLGALLARTSPPPPTLPVSFNAWGIAWQSAEMPFAPGTCVIVRVHLDANAALPLELSAITAEPLRRDDGALWQRASFAELGDTLTDAIERLVFRMHRRQLAEERAGNRAE